MLYDYQYDIAAIGITIILGALYFMRRSLLTRSKNIFFIVILFDFLAAVCDVFSCFAISYPDRFSLRFAYISTLGFLFFFNMMAVTYFLYIESKADIPATRRPSMIFAVCMTIFDFVTIVSSPWTHWVGYFDADGNYCHGPIIVILYVIPFILFAVEMGLFIYARDKFNRYQLYASIAYLIIMPTCIIVQVLVPRLMIDTMGCAVIMFFVYIAYENPSVYTYRDTQCLNRPAFLQVIRSYKAKKLHYDVVAFNITDYEYIRSRYSQSVAEQLNTRIADLLYRNFGDKAFYLATDRYALILPTDKNMTESVVAALQDLFSKPIKLNEVSVKIAINVGYLRDLDESYRTSNVEELVAYILSNKGAEQSSEQILKEFLDRQRQRNQILHIIQRALANDEFQVYYQPIRNVHTNQFESAEALLRLQDPVLGFINPEELVVIAEANGYISQIGQTIFTKVCAFIRDQGLEKLGVHYIEINLSPAQCLDPSLPDTFAGIMAEYNVRPDQINLEITETAQMADESTVMANVDLMRQRGISFSIDDFGSGFASVDYLITMPASIVKIDKTILWKAMENDQAMTILKGTMSMLHGLGKSIVVEGVETQEMVDLLEANYCDYMQGYIYSKPLAGPDYISFLKKNSVLSE